MNLDLQLFLIVIAILLLPLFLAIWYFLFVRYPYLGCFIVITEVILGGNGRWLSIVGGSLTPRYLLFAALILGVGLRLVLHAKMPKLMLRQPVILFIAVLIYGVVLALALRNPDPIGEPQVWGYLLLYPLIVEIWKNKKFERDLLRLLVICTVIMTVLQLAMMSFANINPSAFYEIYARTPLEDMRITAPRLVGTSINYIFWGNSALQGYVVAIFMLTLASRNSIQNSPFSRNFMLISCVLCVLGMVFSMTRGTWGQLLLTLLLIGSDLLIRRKLPSRIIVMGMTALVVFAVIVVVAEPIREAFIARFMTLLPGNRDELNEGDSVIVKAEENSLIFQALSERPLLGYGFGEGQYGYLGEVMEDRSRFHNWFLGFALKTGFLGLTVLIILLCSAIYLAFKVGAKIKKSSPFRRDVLIGMVYGLVGTALASTSNPYMGTPAIICSIALLFAFTDLSYRQWQMQGTGDLNPPSTKSTTLNVELN